MDNGFGCVLLVTFALGLYFGISGARGIMKRKLDVFLVGGVRPAHAEGDAAFLTGWVLVILSSLCIVIPDVDAINSVLHFW